MKHDQAYFLDFLIFSLFSSTTAWLDFLFTFSLDFLTFSLLSSLAFFFSSSILDFLSKMGSSAGFFLISCASSIQGSSEKRHLKKKNTKYKVSLSTWKHLWALFQLLQEFIRGKDHLGLQMKTWDMLSHILLTILTISPTFWCLDKLDMATTTLNTFCF